MRRVAALAAVALLGCGEDEAWHADAAFTAEERAAIVDAEAWIARNVGRPSRGVAFDGGERCTSRCIHRGTAPGGVYYRDDETGAQEIYVNPDGRILDSAYGRTAYRFEALVAHEIGHYYGLRHHDGVGVMNPEAMTFNWTKVSAKACARDVREVPETRYLVCAPPEPPYR